MKPILFNTAMVRAIMDGRKTVTRRVVKPQPSETAEMRYCFAGGRKGDVGKWHDWQQGVMDAPRWTPPCNTGDILYVRETWCDPSEYGYHPILYKADFPIHYDAEDTEFGEPIDLRAEDYAWKPSIHMPRDYARIFLRVTNVRVERLQDIMDDPPGPNNQVVREGCKYGCDFIALWDRTIKEADKSLYGWDANPWVWVIEFERINMERDD